MSAAAFYCVADERYFLGAVGMVNSLRLVGHTEPIHLLDCGLTAEQRALLEDEVVVVDAPPAAPPTLLKTIAPLRRPARSMVLIDTDLIVTRRLDELLDGAAAGNVVGFCNDTQRHVPAWAEVLDLPAVRPQPYLSFAAVAVGGDDAVEILELLADRQALIDFDRTYWRERRVTSYPLLYADQDVLNAILAGRVERDRLVALDADLCALPPFDGLRVVDAATVRCAYEDGREPMALHHWLVKPWLEPTHHGVYSQLLQRLLSSDDVAIRVPEEWIPPRLRRGVRAYAERKLINVRERWRWHVREPLERLAGGER